MTKFENELTFGESKFYYCDLRKVFQQYPKLKKLPNTLKILLESNLRNNKDQNIETIIDAFESRDKDFEISFTPSRILMDDLKGTPILVELAMIREFVKSLGKNERQINPQVMIDFVVDHSLNVQSAGSKHSLSANIKNEIDENYDRFEFLKWASKEFENLNIVPPGFGVGHQINLEFLSTMLSIEEYDNKQYMIPEVLAGSDTHISMINSLGVLASNFEELDCLSSILGENIYLNLPKVLGVKISGIKDKTVNFSDVIINLVEFIKEKTSELKGNEEFEFDFIEFYGDSIKDISLENRATISNMAFELGVKCAYFSVDDQTIKYASKTRNLDAGFIEDYYKRQDLYFNEEYELEYDSILEFDLSLVQSAIAGPNTPNTKVYLQKVASKLKSFKRGNNLRDNDIVLASITSCLSTSNPFLIIQAALLAKNAVNLGLSVNPNIKTSFTPGSMIVRNYLQELGLLEYLENLGFGIVGFGCGVCAGNSGHLFPNVESEISQYNLNVSSVSSGNQNFQDNVNSMIKSNWLMSPALVIAYSLKGSVNFNIKIDKLQKNIYLKDIWPSDYEVQELVDKINYNNFPRRYATLFNGDAHWLEIKTSTSSVYDWNSKSTYLKPFNYFEDIYLNKLNINNGVIAMYLGDDINSNDILPTKNIPIDSVSGKYLNSLNIHPDRFATYEKRKTNYNILVQSLFSSQKIQNKIVNKTGAFTKDFKTEETIPLMEFSSRYKNSSKILLVGQNFASSQNCDSIAKSMYLIGIEVIICESIDNNFRKALISYGILPLKLEGQKLENLSIVGNEYINIYLENFTPNEKFQIELIQNNQAKKLMVSILITNHKESIYFKNGGKINYLIKNMIL